MRRDQWQGWYLKAKNKGQYKNQKIDFQKYLKEIPIELKVVLDVGCGDFRMKDLFNGKYIGVDRVTTRDNIRDRMLYKRLAKTFNYFDLSFTSLSLLCLKFEDANEVLTQLLKLSKYVYLYEETDLSNKYINEDKYHHNYLDMHTDKLIFYKQSEINDKWRIFIYKGEKNED